MKNIPFLFLFLLFWSCANVQAPSGGPEDKAPPKIVEFFPQNKTADFKENKISIVFDKYMNRPSVKENIFISPTVKFKTDWSGKNLEIEFNETLKENTTYSFTLGTEYSDWKSNKPAEAFNLIFSTGQTIDSGYIEGMIKNTAPGGTFVYAYKIDDINPDTLNYGLTPPHYWTQVGSNGKFRLNALKDGTYRILAATDEYKDNIFTEGVDKFGTADSDVLVMNYIPNRDISIFTGPPIDRLGPALTDVRALFSDYLELNFIEDIDQNSIDIRSIIVSYKNTNQVLGVKNFDLYKNDKTKLLIRTEFPLDTSQIALLNLDTKNFVIKDTFGLAIQDSGSSAEFFGSYIPDETIPIAEIIGIKDSSENEMPDIHIKIYFNIGIEEDINEYIKFIDLDDNFDVQYEFDKLSSNYYLIKPKGTLDLDKWYKFEADFRHLTGTNGQKMPDTNIVVSFKTVDSRRFSKLSGKLSASACNGKFIVGLIDKKGTISDHTIVNDDMTWDFDPVKTGIYNILIFCDENDDGILSHGNTDPFKFSEKFKIIDKQIEVKSRWELEDIKLKFD